MLEYMKVRRRWSRHRAAIATLGAIAAASAMPSSAAALIYETPYNDFNLCDNFITDGGVQSKFEATGAYDVWWTWTDDPNHTTVISINNPATLELWGKTSIPAHSTARSYVGRVPNSGSFRLRGRTAEGAGCMYNHDGLLRR